MNAPTTFRAQTGRFEVGDRVELPDIEAEGQRIANETHRNSNGMYLWTDLVGAIQEAIYEERQRHSGKD